MPQSSQAQRDIMNKWFGDSLDTFGPMRFLASHGYTEKAGMYSKPTPSYNPSADEVECLLFLRDEWDFGIPHNLYPTTPSSDLEQSRC